MSRLRKIDRDILSGRAIDGDEEIPDHPMDSEEQEELIQKFEVNNSLLNKRCANVLSLTYLLFSGFCVMLAGKAQGRETGLFVLIAQSIICSMILARYELMHSYTIFRRYSIHINNSRIQKVNVILIVLIEWIGFEAHKSWRMFMFRQIPLIFFLITKILKKWSNEMEKELNQLRKMKYKYKNA
ncbi:hypothetical protein HG536_0C03950 [Torulaspora globosa]|uniref:Uncharacterized protein n=1 Tax=Torulaspora globosa TaxID=48254 RepID=A0A7G3ZFE0_9SACH|nr:uncharacterized protein HG536_0C03950 [Torulaspora globosa]QLL32226.1 hypothetical protein HG536_0C03950 [Torulaspora globosa]